MTDLKYVGPNTHSEADGKAALKSGDYDVAPIGWGLVFVPVCIRSTVDPVAAASAHTNFDPPGTSRNEWTYVAPSDLPDSWHSADVPEADRVYPRPCSDHPETHIHVLLAC